MRRVISIAAIVGAVCLAAESRPHGQSGARAQTIAPANGAALQDWVGVIDQMQRRDLLRVSRTEADALVAGRNHERLNQYYLGVPVFGADVRRQLEGTQVVSLFGVVYSDVSVPTTSPALSPNQARDAVVAATGADVRSVLAPELMILPLDAGGYALAYRTVARTSAGPLVYFIDAANGRTLLEYNNLQTQSAVQTGNGVLGDRKKVSLKKSGSSAVADDQLRPPVLQTFDMKGNLARTKLILNGIIDPNTVTDIATAPADPWTDGAAVDAHTYQGWTYDYYFKRMGRKGLDNKDTPIWGFVHPVDRATYATASTSDFGSYYVNAFWDGYEMLYGEGLPPNVTLSGQHWNYLAGGLDVVAHELTHGVTQYTSNLIYRNESGALNEAFSDIIGTSVEFYFADARGKTGNYLMGEDVVTVGGLRSMKDPRSYGDPDHYSIRFTGTADNGGVHTNSGIANNAYYLAIEGGNNRTSGLAVAGVGAANRDQIEKVFYRGFTQLLPANATFAVARSATIQAARDLYGAGSAAEKAITQAWTAVGVN